MLADLVRHAAQPQPLEWAQTAASHHDQVNVVCSRAINNDLSGISTRHDDFEFFYALFAQPRFGILDNCIADRIENIADSEVFCISPLLIG